MSEGGLPELSADASNGDSLRRTSHEIAKFAK